RPRAVPVLRRIVVADPVDEAVDHADRLRGEHLDRATADGRRRVSALAPQLRGLRGCDVEAGQTALVALPGRHRLAVPLALLGLRLGQSFGSRRGSQT